MRIETCNPATGKFLKHYDCLTEKEMLKQLKQGEQAFQVWKKTPFSHRKQCLVNLAKLVLQRKEEFAILMAKEMGKPLCSGRAEIEKCAWVCEHYAEMGEQYLGARTLKLPGKQAEIVHQPLGLILGIMPWNYPFWQVFRFAVPTLMAGNGVILKHAPISTGTGLAIAELCLEAGFPEALFQTFILENKQVKKVIAHPAVQGLSLTGSVATGKKMAALAGRYLKKFVLELGGSDPYLILEDADLDLAAKTIVQARLNNSGQSCISPKRIIALSSIYTVLAEKIEAVMKQYKMGDPLESQTDLGPMAREDLRKTLHAQVVKSVQLGAIPLLGAELLQGPGFYYPPTLLINVKKNMPAFKEELFGPVLAMIEAEDEGKAISLANQSAYGLGAAIFTQNVKKGERLAREDLNAGTCAVNAVVMSDPRLPFGGIKHSGIGRELSQEGILEFVNIKTVVVNEVKNG